MFDQRVSRRYPLQLPFKFISPSSVAGIEGQTYNVSSGGVAFAGKVGIQPGEIIEYIIQLVPDGTAGVRVALHCTGKLLRTQEGCGAATLERYEFVRQFEE